MWLRCRSSSDNLASICLQFDRHTPQRCGRQIGFRSKNAVKTYHEHLEMVLKSEPFSNFPRILVPDGTTGIFVLHKQTSMKTQEEHAMFLNMNTFK